MRPVFSGPKQAAAFALLLLVLLAGPLLSPGKIGRQQREKYSSQTIRWEMFPWVQKFIYEETNDIDIAFVGSSHICDGIDTPYVQKALEERLGRPAVVRTVGWYNPGFDSLYFCSKDLLAHRHVKMLVFYDECSGPQLYEVHKVLPQWFRWSENDGVLQGLAFKYRAIFYYAAVLGMPRQWLQVLTSNLRPEPSDVLTGNFAYKHSANPEIQLGSMATHLGFDPTYVDSNANYIAYAPQTVTTPADVTLYSPATATNFAFSERPLPETEIYFARQFALLARSNNCNLVELHMPAIDEKKSPTMIETRNWAELMQTPVTMMGVTPQHLFSGLSESEMELLFADPGHLNINGQKYFTRLITPTLLQLYESNLQH
jgi:hypothetical protein